VIVEHEFLEQVAEAGCDWSLSRCVEFLERHKDPWPVLQALYQDKCLEFFEENGNSLPAWKAEEIFRNHDISSSQQIIVRVTDKGVKRANY
jgi:hypothetical protein